MCIRAWCAESGHLRRFGDLSKNTSLELLSLYLVCYIDLYTFLEIVKWMGMPKYDLQVTAAAEPDPILVVNCDGGNKTLHPLTWSQLELDVDGSNL